MSVKRLLALFNVLILIVLLSGRSLGDAVRSQAPSGPKDIEDQHME